MKPPVVYFGSKGRLAPWIVSLMPQHRVYIEPFAGSAAVLFAKPPVPHEVINDMAGDLVNFYRMLRERPGDLELACRLTPYARDEYNAAEIDASGIDDLERARRWWVRSSQSFGQMAKVGTGWSMSVQRGSNNARSVWNRLDRFAEAAERLGPVAIENRDALDCIAAYDCPQAVTYVDAPYLASTRTSFNDANGRARRPGGDYSVEFNTPAEHQALAETVARCRGAVLVSGYPSPLYDELYAGWDRVERVVLCRVSNGLTPRNGHRTEVIWSNRPLAQGLFAEGSS